MNRNEARDDIKRRAKEYLQPDHSRKGYICPICGSGSGKNGTGITTKDGIHFTCWAGCFENADIIDIIGLERGISDYNGKLTAAASIFGIMLDSYQRITPEEAFSSKAAGNHNQPKNKQNTQQAIHNSTHTTGNTQEAETDYTDFFLQANKDIERTAYHRGLTLETLNRFKVGYVESWRHPKVPKAPASPRLIIPISKYSYLARDTRAELTEEQKTYCKSKVGKARTFNIKAVSTAQQPIFITEGEINAMSVIDVGGEAIALGSISYTRIFFEALKGCTVTQPFIIALDNEKAQDKQVKVEDAVNKLIAGFMELGLPFYRLNIYGAYKDANEALNADREGFKTAILNAVEQVQREEAAKLEADKMNLKHEAAAYSLQDFINSIENSKTANYTPTGFSQLDGILDGGLYAGLYIVGAISSLGKTTFCLQIADQIAQRGRDVLIFSLEMAKNELIAKSVSRLTLLQDLQENGSTANAKTTRGILTGAKYRFYSDKEKELIQKAVTAYSEYAEHIYITEGIGNVGIEQIRERVQKQIKLTGEAPVVLIDYLQIIAPADIRGTDKQNTDKAVLELKRMSRDYSLPVIGISSFNRDNYSAPVNLASFKESGAIEYSSDVLIGLQYSGMDYQEGEADKAREKRIRELIKLNIANAKSGQPQSIQVKILKNRNGSKGESLLDYYPKFNYFTENKPAEEAANSEWVRAESSYTK